MKHTPTPWSYAGNVDSSYPQKTQLVLQAKTKSSANIAKIIPCMGMTAQEVEANAKRIVECVNACSGIEDPGCSIPKLEHMRHQLEFDLNLMREERDYLLKVVKLASASWRELAKATGEEGLLPEDVTYQTMLKAITSVERDGRLKGQLSICVA